MKIVIFGGYGYLGTALRTIYPHAIAPQINIADAIQVRRVLADESPQLVINAAGKTGRPNVDWCETHQYETLQSNLIGPLLLLEECARRDIYWVHLSTGCIYSGDNDGKGYGEEDPPNFTGSFYSRSKAWAEQILKEFPVLIIRLRMPFDHSDHPRNLINKLISYTRVVDVQNSFTYVPDFLTACKTLIAQRAVGVYNIVNDGCLSPFEIIQQYRRLIDPDHPCEPMTGKELSQITSAGRSHCILRTEKLHRAGIHLQPVRQAIDEALRKMADRR